MFCVDSLSTCEPWEAVWAPGVKVSCLPTCASALSPCTTLRVTGASGSNGDYDRMSLQDYKDNRPAYKLRGESRYLFASGSQWKLGPGLGGDAIHTSGGEWGQLSSIMYPGFPLVKLLHCCPLIGRELQIVEIFS